MDDVKNFVKDLLNDYAAIMSNKSCVDIGDWHVSIIVDSVDDVYGRFVELAADSISTRKLDAYRPFLETTRGTAFIENDMSKATLLIRNNIFKDEYDKIFTLFHEYLHVIDILTVCNKLNFENPQELENNYIYRAFYYWTEYRVERKIHEIKWCADKNNKNFSEEAMRYINELLLSDIKAFDERKDDVWFTYDVVRYFAKFALLNEIYPGTFTPKNNFPQQLFHNMGDNLIPLHEVLEKTYDLDIREDIFTVLGLKINSFMQEVVNNEP